MRDYRGAGMRVLMVTPRFRPDVGGVERHVEQVGRRLAKLGAEITVVTTGLERSLPRAESVDGVSIRRVRAWPERRDYYLAPRIYREVAAEVWDVVHVQSFHTLVAPTAMLAALRQKLPYVVTFHGGGHSSRLRNRLRGTQLLALRPLLARADRLVAVARFEIEHYGRRLHLPPDKFVLIPNGADLPPAAPKATPDATGPLIASVGRLERYKGHHRILAALPHILRRAPDARLWIAGTGAYEPELRKLAAQLGVSDRVRIEAVAGDGPEGMASRLAEAAVVVLLSEYETHPLAAIEALALGKSVVVADTSGLRELADQGLARAIPLQSDPAAVAAAVLAEIDRPSLARAPNLPTWDDCAAGHLALYRAVAKGHACGS